MVKLLVGYAKQPTVGQIIPFIVRRYSNVQALLAVIKEVILQQAIDKQKQPR
ncbi:MAG: hypothetical protein IPJ02_00650 [Chitinophagaceae bacterium]|nr:hypothetical protein [Chitinophagaceae bacterium]